MLNLARAVLVLFVSTAGAPQAQSTPWSIASTGSAGLLRVYSAERLPSGRHAFKIQSGFFTAKDFMIDGYDHRSLDASLSYTHSPFGFSFMDRLEFSFALEGSSHPIRVRSAALRGRRAESQLDLSVVEEEGTKSNNRLGNPAPAVKIAVLRSGFYKLSLFALARVHSGQSALNPASLSPTALVVNTCDWDPFYVHLNLGGYWDRSEETLERPFNTIRRPFRFAQGLYVQDSWVAGVAAEARLGFGSGFIELFTYQDMDGKAVGSRQADEFSGVFEMERIGIRQNPIWVTPGFKGRLGDRWVLEGAVDLGLLSGDFPGGVDGEVLPPWRMVVGLSYVTGGRDRRRWGGVGDGGIEGGGRLAGRVVDKETGEPISGAEIRLVGEEFEPRYAIPGGHFEFERLPAGEHRARVTAEGYEAQEVTAGIDEGGVTRVSVVLGVQVRPTVLRGRVTDADTGEPLRGVPVVMSGPVEYAPTTDGEGRFDPVESVPGRYDVRVEVEGFEPYREPVEVGRGETVELVIRPVKKLVVKIVEVPPPPEPVIPPPSTASGQPSPPPEPMRKIEISHRVQFEFNQAKLLEASFLILDEVAKILIDHPELNVRVEGHTDNVGEKGVNRKLSLERAIAVVDYLAGKGVDRKRFVPAGLGDSKPIAPNEEEWDRAKNRRVEFVITEEKPTE